MRFKLAVLFSVFLTINHSYAFVTVGESPGLGTCDYTTLNAALSSGDSEIRVVTDDFIENIAINQTVTMIGGYTSCNHADSNVPEPTEKSWIWGTAVLGESAVKINLNNTLVELKNLYIRDAAMDVSVFNGGHGVLIEGAAGTVNIVASTIANNRSAKGAGIYVTEVGETKKYVNVIDSSVFANVAPGSSPGNGFGGGIYCSGVGNTVSVIGESDVSSNWADYGGGIAAEYGCLAFVNSGIDVTASATKRGVMNNTAGTNGGGVYVGNGSRFILNPTYKGGQFGTIIGDRDVPATLAGNSAGSKGGGVYAEFNSDVRFKDVLIHDNDAGDDGGGVYLATNSDINASRSAYECWNPEACLVFSDNTADKGGAVYMSNTNSASNFINTSFHGNRANDASVMHINGLTGLVVYIMGSYFYGNGNNGAGGYADFSAFRISNDSTVFFAHTTMADNDLADASWVIINSNSVLRLYNSIIHNDEIVLLESGSAQSTADCLIVNDDTNVAAANVYVEADPGFVDRPGHDYHLRPDSIAVDLCDRDVLASAGFDNDGDTRGIDIVARTNIEGPFDAGADEYNDFDLVFENEFE